MPYKKYIEDRCQPIPHVGCWLWLLSVGSHGYGQACIGAGTTVAHRVSYLAFNGEIPAGKIIQHSCDNRWCVNPDHLSLGTHKSNAIDKQLKGRAAKKIPFEEREKIRTRYNSGVATKQDLADEYGVTTKAIWQVIHRYGMHGIQTTSG